MARLTITVVVETLKSSVFDLQMSGYRLRMTFQSNDLDYLSTHVRRSIVRPVLIPVEK